jgi:hypothetical protein
MSAAGFIDATASGTLAARVLTRDDAAVAHQLPGILEPRHLAKLGHDRHGIHLGDSAQAPQRLDHRTAIETLPEKMRPRQRAHFAAERRCRAAACWEWGVYIPGRDTDR